MEEYDIDINEAGNWVYLPKNLSVSCDDVCTHSKVHTNVYRKNVADRLQGLKNKEDIYEELNIIRNELLLNKNIY